eukprot:g34737.t1
MLSGSCSRSSLGKQATLQIFSKGHRAGLPIRAFSVAEEVGRIQQRVRTYPRPTWNELSHDLQFLLSSVPRSSPAPTSLSGLGGAGAALSSETTLHYTRPGWRASDLFSGFLLLVAPIAAWRLTHDKGSAIDLQALSGMSDQFEEYDHLGRPAHAKSTAKPKRTTLDDVIGCHEAKTELEDIVGYLREPEKYQEMGCEMPKGILMVGPPGVGKTLMARALAGEAGVPYLVTDGASFDQVFVGIGTLRVQKLFQRARQIAPCIIFIDEIDAVGSKRDEPMNVRRNTLNQLLVEMDGFKGNEGILVMAATNLPEILDSALLRPGRFDRTVQVDAPDRRTRAELISYYLKNRETLDVTDKALDILAGSTAGLTGADIKNMVNMAAIEAVKGNSDGISLKHLAEVVEIVRMGRRSEGLEISEQTRKLTAWHEAGHAIISLYTQGSDPIYKATLVPRGGALGMVSSTPTDEYLISKQKLSAFMDMAMGGRAAEELIFGEDFITQGAGNDFMKATNIARQMVTQYGMNDKVGKVFYTEEFMNRELAESTQDLINHEVQVILQASYDRAKRVLLEHKREHKLLAEALLVKETLDMNEIMELLQFDPKQKTQPSMCDGEATPLISKEEARTAKSKSPAPRKSKTTPDPEVKPQGGTVQEPITPKILAPSLATDSSQ